MNKFTVITVPQDLLPQVVGELLMHAVNPDHVLVVHEEAGRVIHAHPEVAEAWFQFHEAKESAPKAEPEPVSKPVAETVIPEVISKPITTPKAEASVGVPLAPEPAPVTAPAPSATPPRKTTTSA